MSPHLLNTDNDYTSKYEWSDWPGPNEVETTPATVTDYLWRGGEGGAETSMLGDIVCLRDWLDDIETLIVFRARKSGYSWSQIGHVLGVTKQAAQQKFGAMAQLVAALANERAATDEYEAHQTYLDNDTATLNE